MAVAPQGALGPGAGVLFLAFQVSAKRGVRCTLQGWPSVQVTAADHEWTITAARDTFAVPPGGVLDARHPATFQLDWNTEDSEQLCAFGDVTQRVVRVALPHGGGTTETNDHRPLVPCRAVTHVSKPRTPLAGLDSRPFLLSDATFYPGPYLADLSVAIIKQPQMVRPGQVLAYTVLIQASRNNTWFTGNACFGYTETLGLVTTTLPEPVLRRERHELNCVRATRFSQGGLEFAMRIRVPTTVRPGSMLDLFWQSDAGSRGGINETDAGINVVP